MIKRIAALLLAILLVFSAGCTKQEGAKTVINESNPQKGSAETIVTPKKEWQNAEITIMTDFADAKTIGYEDALNSYIDKFKRDYGVNVRIEEIGSDPKSWVEAHDREEFLQKLATKLYVREGPELIFTELYPIGAVTQENAVVDLRGKVQNLENVYPGLLEEKAYFLPVGIESYSKGLNKEVLEALDIKEPPFNWTKANFYKIWDQWSVNSNIYFTGNEFFMIYDRYLKAELYKSFGEKAIKLNSPQVLQGVNKIRQEIFSGKYKIPEGYKYENFYNMLYEEASEESKWSRDIYQPDHLDKLYVSNIFFPKATESVSKTEKSLPMPQFSDEAPVLYAYGFAVNKNGKNLELAYEFLNGLLSEETQMSFYKSDFEGRHYPVIMSLEDDIFKLEEELKLSQRVKELKKYALEQVKKGKCSIRPAQNHKESDFYYAVQKDLVKYIFADSPYPEQKMKQELQKLEDKYNIWLNE